MVSLFMKVNYKDLLTSVKFHLPGSSIVFSSLSCKIIFIVGIPVLKAISLEMLHQMHLQIYFYYLIQKKLYFIHNNQHVSNNNTYQAQHWTLGALI